MYLSISSFPLHCDSWDLVLLFIKLLENKLKKKKEKIQRKKKQENMKIKLQ
jgi:hypothetical protein